MKPFLRAQLERYAQRLSELDFLLSREDIMKDMTQFLALPSSWFGEFRLTSMSRRCDSCEETSSPNS